eukprot:Hpha_TRINITY_DN17304_c0_g1::TRINITY_DN17304_c0_g1_i1::g.137974::m.137974
MEGASVPSAKRRRGEEEELLPRELWRAVREFQGGLSDELRVLTKVAWKVREDWLEAVGTSIRAFAMARAREGDCGFIDCQIVPPPFKTGFCGWTGWESVQQDICRLLVKLGFNVGPQSGLPVGVSYNGNIRLKWMYWARGSGDITSEDESLDDSLSRDTEEEEHYREFWAPGEPPKRAEGHTFVDELRTATEEAHAKWFAGLGLKTLAMASAREGHSSLTYTSNALPFAYFFNHGDYGDYGYRGGFSKVVAELGFVACGTSGDWSSARRSKARMARGARFESDGDGMIDILLSWKKSSLDASGTFVDELQKACAKARSEWCLGLARELKTYAHARAKDGKGSLQWIGDPPPFASSLHDEGGHEVDLVENITSRLGFEGSAEVWSDTITMRIRLQWGAVP